MEKIISYVDGFNLYFGLKDKGWKKYYWLNVKKLCENLTKDYQKLVMTKYFTSRVSYPIEKQKRQSTYIEALETLDDFKLFFGKYQLNKWKCFKCSYVTGIHNEKMTDVNIAVELLADAFQDQYDTALIISADSDLAGPILKIKELFPSKKIVVAFPPKRLSNTLINVADANFRIGRKKIADSLFPSIVKKPNGYILECPKEWS
jgi:uncharacterized LabA/DUF88 family protein